MRDSEPDSRKSTRLKSFDYSSNGYYFITICAVDKALYYDNKQFLEDAFHSLPDKTNGVKLDYTVFMPDHMHSIIILEDSPLALGEIIRRYKASTSFQLKVKNLWQRGFYEHVIRNESALFSIRKYIQENPEKADIDAGIFYYIVGARFIAPHLMC